MAILLPSGPSPERRFPAHFSGITDFCSNGTSWNFQNKEYGLGRESQRPVSIRRGYASSHVEPEWHQSGPQKGPV